MTPLAGRFEALRSRGEKALVLFVTAGDPSLDELPAILSALVEGGADAIEIGLPFSDPIADGPTIQASSQRALERGVTPRRVLETLQANPVEVPLILMGYYNPILRLGLEGFADAARSAGVSGTIVCDAIPEDLGDWIGVSRGKGLDNVLLAAPTSTDARLDAVCAAGSGFVYAVSRTGVTGAGSEVPPEVKELVGRLRARTDLPIAVGFGVSTPEHVRLVCEVADGAVIGSWLVDWLAKHWQGRGGRAELVREVAARKAATRG